MSLPLSDAEARLAGHYQRTARAFHDLKQTTYRNWGYWGPGVLTQHQASEALVEAVLARGEVGARSRILDVGCGAGASTRYIAARTRSPEVHGIDICDALIDEASRASSSKAAPSPVFRVMNACALDYPDASVDAVVMVDGAAQFADREAFLRESARVLVAPGRLLMADLLFERGCVRVLGRTLDSLASMAGIPPKNRQDERGYRMELERSGFTLRELVRVGGSVFSPYLFHYLHPRALWRAVAVLGGRGARDFYETIALAREFHRRGSIDLVIVAAEKAS